MAVARKHSEKRIFVSYREGAEWESWFLRFNRGSKKNKPVKFFASLEWKTANAGCPHAGTNWDFSDEKTAEAWFVESLSKYGGQVHPHTRDLVTKLAALGYEPYNFAPNADARNMASARRLARR